MLDHKVIFCISST